MEPKTIWDKLAEKEAELGPVEYTKWLNENVYGQMTDEERAQMDANTDLSEFDDIDFADL